MQTSEAHAVKVLNGLIETTIDSAEGYKEAALHTTNAEYRTMFNERSQRRRDLCRKLQEEVRSFGAQPEDEQTLMGKLHARFVALKERIDHSDKALIDEVEHGEDVIKARYAKAAADADLPARVRDVLAAAYAAVKSEHDEISRIKHSLH